jgi:hypothetical protein
MSTFRQSPPRRRRDWKPIPHVFVVEQRHELTAAIVQRRLALQGNLRHEGVQSVDLGDLSPRLDRNRLRSEGDVHVALRVTAAGEKEMLGPQVILEICLRRSGRRAAQRAHHAGQADLVPAQIWHRHILPL